ncbi:hypothetical protein [Bacillus cereus]|uniref:hypothetical protein n=1 Tax=Bacillus cereus TaxID=1396 RepID=UPI003018E6EE
MRKSFYNITKKLGLPRIQFHNLRHTHVTVLIQHNVNVKLISKRFSYVLTDRQRSVAETEKTDEVFEKCDLGLKKGENNR